MSLDVELRSSQGCARSLRNRTLPRRASITAGSATIALPALMTLYLAGSCYGDLLDRATMTVLAT